MDAQCHTGDAESSFCDFNCKQYLYDYGRCSASDQSRSEARREYEAVSHDLVGLFQSYWDNWDKLTEYFPFSTEPMCTSPNPNLFKEGSKCRHDMLFNDKCDWECYHENCDYDFFGNGGTARSFTSRDMHCGRPTFNPRESETETLLQFEIRNYGDKTPIPDMQTVEVCLWPCH